MKSNLKDFLFIGFIITVLLLVILNPVTSLYPPQKEDEQTYYAIVQDWTNQIQNSIDVKPVFFLGIQKLLDGDMVKTRLLNLILILINTFLIYQITKSRLAILYIAIPIFLNSMWLTVETIETFLLLLSILYFKNRGAFIGLAALFRPYAALYFILLDKKNLIKFVLVGLLGASILWYFGILDSYLYRLAYYGTTVKWSEQFEPFTFIFLVIFFYLGFNRKNPNNTLMISYALIACIPIFFRLYAHYFITPYTMLFVAYLQQRKYG